jgi:O-antigen ligase
MFFYGAPLIVGLFVLFAQKDRLLFLLTVSLFLLPFAGIDVPPRSLGISFLNIISLLVGILILYRNLSSSKKIELAQHKYLIIPLVAVIPSVLLSEVFYLSLLEYLKILGYYALFIGFSHYVAKEDWGRQFVYGITVALLIVSVLIIFERFTGIDPSLTRHARTFTRLGGVLITRSSGIFQDPQKAAQYVAVASVFLVVLLLRKASSDKKLNRLIKIALLVSAPALLLTVTRASIYTWAAVMVFSILLLNRYNILGKMFIWISAILLVVVTLVLGAVSYEEILPSDLRTRMEHSDGKFNGRTDVWSETWYIFEDRPITGIGLGAYKSYLIKTNYQMRKLAASGHATKVPTMPENGYLKILYETGVIGSFSLFSLVLLLMFRCLKEIVRSTGSSATFMYAVAMAGAVFLASFFTIFTLADSRNATLLVLLLTTFANKKAFADI